MNRLVHYLTGIFAAAVFLLSHPAQAGTCKLSIVMDRSGSMMMPRTDGSLKPNGQPQTRCWAAGVAVQQSLSAYILGDVFDITEPDGVVTAPDPTAVPPLPPDVYDTKCPNLADRQISIWVFQDNQMIHLTRTAAWPTGFAPVLEAATLYLSSPYWSAATDEPNDSCAGNTPLAQTMCLSTRIFPAGLPAASDLREGWTFTDGAENYSTAISLAGDQNPPCRLPGEPSDPQTGAGGWGDRVKAEYMARGVQGHGFLFAEGAVPLLLAQAAILEPIEAQQGGSQRSAAAALAGSPDEIFFTSLANATGGRFTLVPDDLVISTATYGSDVDGDGIPDFRDFCPFTSCAGSDTDNDGIPNSQDACVLAKEDGNGPFPADGCKDSTATG